MTKLIKLKAFLYQLGIEERDINIQYLKHHYVFRFGYYNRLDKFREEKLINFFGAEMDAEEDYSDGFMRYKYYIKESKI